MEENKNIENNNPKKKKIDVKKALRNVLALALVAVISIVGTLAYLQYKTDPVPNTFVGSEDISLKVIEPDWEKNPGQDGNGDDITDSNDSYNTNDTAEGERLAESYTPGLTIPKDPMLVNSSSKDYEEWVAIRVDYCINRTQVAYDKFAKNSSTNTILSEVLEEIEFNTTAGKDTTDGQAYWIPITVTEQDAKYQVYVYSKKLGKSAKTEPLFSSVKINEKIQKVSDKYPEIDIFITGGAVKVEDKHDFDTLEVVASNENGYDADDEAEKELIKAALLTEVAKVTLNELLATK